MTDRATQLTLPQGAVLLLPDGTTYPLTGDLKIDTDIERVRTSMPMRLPDESWSYTDPNGHTHAYVRDDDVPRLPTLERRVRQEPCDGSCGNWDCEGWSVEEWFCRECDVQVEPGFTLDYTAVETGIPVSSTSHYTLTADLPLPAAPGGVIEVGAGESLFPPIENAVIAWTDNDGNQNHFTVPPVLTAGDSLNFEAGSRRVRVELYGYLMNDFERKPTGP